MLRYLILTVGLAVLSSASLSKAESLVGAGGFRDQIVFEGLTGPVNLAFASNGHVFVAEKRGTVQLFEDLDDSVPTEIVDIRTAVNDFWERGLLGLAVDPDYPESPWLYLLYTQDALEGEVPPLWGLPDQSPDSCANPPGAMDGGCVVSGVLARALIDPESQTSGPLEILLSGWCQQFQSHSIGDIAFGPDGALYVSAGDGAAAHAVDFGQLGHEYWGGNPCEDPVGEGGALRSQDLVTAGDPVAFNGAVLRLDASTGDALPDNPLVDIGSADDDRLIAFGLRNPFRLAIDDLSGSIYLGDVGWDRFEEINRIADPLDGTIENFGWPCREGTVASPGYEPQSICQTLLGGAAPLGTLTEPLLAIDHNSPPFPERCSASGAFLTGVVVSGSTYPLPWSDALFAVDSGSGCVWSLPMDEERNPDPSSIQNFPVRLLGAVSLVNGPAGEIYFPSFYFGEIHRLRSMPDLLFADDFEGGLSRWSQVEHLGPTSDDQSHGGLPAFD